MTTVTYFNNNIEPKDGDIARGHTLGKKLYHLYVWRVCKLCKVGKWVQKNYYNRLCIKCAGKGHGVKFECKGSVENPQLGDIRYGDELGMRVSQKDAKFVYVECGRCYSKKWLNKLWLEKVLNKKGKYICKDCTFKCDENKKKISGENSYQWKGGITYQFGYRLVRVDKDDPYHEMCSDGDYAKEHRLVMARYLGRCLKPWESVHHKNHIKDDNRIENLELFKKEDHHVLTILENQVNLLEKEVSEQDKLIRYLLWMDTGIKSGVLFNANL